jgi:hypothetical protein
MLKLAVIGGGPSAACVVEAVARHITPVAQVDITVFEAGYRSVGLASPCPQHDRRPQHHPLRRGLGPRDLFQDPTPSSGQSDDITTDRAHTHTSPQDHHLGELGECRHQHRYQPLTRRYGTIWAVIVPTKSVKTHMADDLDFYASQRWPQLEEVTLTWRGSFGYVTAYLSDDEPIPLWRLRYLGLPDEWGFSLYQASTEDYHDTILPTGSPTGTPEQALDCACGLYLNDPTAWHNEPPKD